MWVLGMGAYAVAVMQRTSLGVASFQATERFSAGASLVSLFVGPTSHGGMAGYLTISTWWAHRSSVLGLSKCAVRMLRPWWWLSGFWFRSSVGATQRSPSR